MKLVGKVVTFLLMIVAFKYSIDSFVNESMIQTFGSFALGLVSLIGFIILVEEDCVSDRELAK
ncbi:hypothetical protein [Bacillus massiliigorillae]|uniref:hypothetical protein n=1 Tax=Bacillus massiliigorillae TaxID=1243664 RepID=UPI0003A4094D|nr:hypothetical protein [Bacillus massiliigorillae]